jgi:type IV secretion system protein VirD4
MALVVHCLIETVARSSGSGRVLFMLDEFMQMPLIPAVTKAINLYPGLGVQLWPFVQDRSGLVAKFGKEFVANLEQGSDVLQMWAIEDEEMLRRIEYISGRKSVVTRGINAPGGPVPSVSFGIHEQTRPLLQPEDIRQLGASKQILRIPGYPLFVADRVPYYEIEGYAEVLRDPRDVHRDSRLDVDPRCLNYL